MTSKRRVRAKVAVLTQAKTDWSHLIKEQQIALCTVLSRAEKAEAQLAEKEG